MDINLPILKLDALMAEKSECSEEAEPEDEMPVGDACKIKKKRLKGMRIFNCNC
jgi:hypothetical protein